MSNRFPQLTRLLRQGIWVLFSLYLLLSSSSTYAQNGASISGRVTNSNGEPIAGTTLYLHRFVATPNDPPGYWYEPSRTTSNANGDYTFGPILANTYRIEYVSPSALYNDGFYNNKASRETADDIVVGIGANVMGIDIVLSDSGRVFGTVVDSESNPIAGIMVEAKGAAIPIPFPPCLPPAELRPMQMGDLWLGLVHGRPIYLVFAMNKGYIYLSITTIKVRKARPLCSRSMRVK